MASSMRTPLVFLFLFFFAGCYSADQPASISRKSQSRDGQLSTVTLTPAELQTLQNELNVELARAAALAQRLNTLSAAVPASAVSGLTVINGDMQISGRVCVGGVCQSDADKLQISGSTESSILLVSNIKMTNPQTIDPPYVAPDPRAIHYSRIRLSQGGGLSFVNNQRGGGVSPLNQPTDPFRPFGEVGLDSNSEYYIIRRFNGSPGENLPDMRFVIDEGRKVVSWRAPRPGGWRFDYAGSTSMWYGDVRWSPW
jgi:hypothetical protein